MKRVDINVDLGEGFAFDDELMEIASSVNVCCGAHAGDAAVTRKTVALSREKGLRVGAHPGVPDRVNMGRRPIVTDDAAMVSALVASVGEQLGVADWDYIKPHGALYNATTKRCGLALALCAVIRRAGLPLMGLPGSFHEAIAVMSGVRFIREGFADRAYTEGGLLLPRSEPGAVLSSPVKIAEQVLSLVDRVDSICIHGDSPGCVEIARLVRTTLESNGYEVRA